MAKWKKKKDESVPPPSEEADTETCDAPLTSEMIHEDQEAAPINDHPKFHKFKKPLGGEN